MDANGIVENFREIVTKHYVDFNGRSARAPFWYFILAYIILAVAASILDSVFGFGVFSPMGYYTYSPRPITSLLELALLLPSLGISVRRLHDTNHSGWGLLFMLLPVVGWLLLLYFYVQPGTTGSNQYGNEPSTAPVAA